MFNCPECWAPFDTKKEMTGHQGRAHKIKVKMPKMTAKTVKRKAAAKKSKKK